VANREQKSAQWDWGFTDTLFKATQNKNKHKTTFDYSNTKLFNTVRDHTAELKPQSHCADFCSRLATIPKIVANRGHS